MATTNEFAVLLDFFPPKLVAEIEAVATLQSIPAHTEMVRIGQYVSHIPLVTKGLIKVSTRHDDKELLLYYIKPQESCIMSFSAALQTHPSPISAVTEEDTAAILLPVAHLQTWTHHYPTFNTLFFQQYNLRYSELLDTIHHVMFQRMDQRLLDYLREKVRLTQRNPLKLAHRQIAQELGTAREVVSRVMKKLENEGKVQQQGTNIKLLEV